MKPYGYEFVNNDEGTTNVAKSTFSYNMPKYIFYLTAFSIMVACVMTQFGNQLPIFAQSVGYTLSIGAMVSSFNMIGNVCGKLMIGAMADKIGIFNAVTVNSIFIAISTIMLMFSGSSQLIMFAGSLILGLCYSMPTTVPPLIFMEVYGHDEYRTYLSRFQAYNAISMALASSLLPYIYDFTGSFFGALLLGTVLTVLSMVMFATLKAKSDKIKMNS